MIRGIAFDLEGTVVNVEEAHHKGHLCAARDVGVVMDLDTALQKIPHFIGGPDKEIAKEIWELSDRTKSVDFIRERDRYYYEQFLKNMTIMPRPGFLEVFQWLKQNDFQMAIGSLTPSRQAKVLLEKSGLCNLFAPGRIVLAENVTEVKPHPEVYFATAARMGINPSEQLVFEDSPRGVEAARKAGSRAVGMPVYTRRETIEALMTAGASRYFSDWNLHDIAELIESLNRAY